MLFQIQKNTIKKISTILFLCICGHGTTQSYHDLLNTYHSIFLNTLKHHINILYKYGNHLAPCYI